VEKKTVSTGFGIVVADRGWVYVGDIEHDGEWCVISNARNIRKWGTSRGLGQIATNGPTEQTVMDDYGTVRVPAHAVITIIDSDQSKWTA